MEKSDAGSCFGEGIDAGLSRSFATFGADVSPVWMTLVEREAGWGIGRVLEQVNESELLRGQLQGRPAAGPLPAARDAAAALTIACPPEEELSSERAETLDGSTEA